MGRMDAVICEMLLQLTPTTQREWSSKVTCDRTARPFDSDSLAFRYRSYCVIFIESTLEMGTPCFAL